MSGIATTFEKLRSIYSAIQVEVGVSDTTGWLTFENLWQAPHHQELLARLRTRYQMSDKHFLAASLLNQYNWLPITAAIGSYYLDQRMPDITPENLLWQFDEQGFVERIGLREGRFYALPTDAEAEAAGCIMPTLSDLQDVFHLSLNAHMQIVVEALRASSGIGKRALWGMVADRIGGLVIYIAELMEREELCESEVQAWVGVEGSQLRGKTGVIWMEHHEHPHPFLQRSACCLSYKVPEYGYCSTCPLLSEEERKERLRQHLIEHH